MRQREVNRLRRSVAAHGTQRLLTVLFLAGGLLCCAQRAEPIEKNRTMIDLGLSFGTRTGVLLGVRYFVLDDLGLGIDLIAAPTGRVHLGIAADAVYYPPFMGGYSYVLLGLSYMFDLREHREGDVFVPLTSSLCALNAGIGGNTPAFQMPPAIESENTSDVPTVFYLELGVGRVLLQTLKLDGVPRSDASTTQGWIFPNVEFGVRQGPFTPAWVQ